MKSKLLESVKLGIIVLALVTACKPPNEFSVIPKISYNRMEFYSAGDIGTDSLILYINFEDGDGDIGLSSTDNEYPYQPFSYIIDSSSPPLLVTYRGTGYKLPFYSVPLKVVPGGFQEEAAPVLFSNTDDRKPYNCQQYDQVTSIDKTGTPLQQPDTFYIQKNPNNKNIFVEFYRKVNNDYQLLDWATAFSSNGCGTDFNARFPIFDKDNLGKSLSGTLRYAMLSAGFGIILKEDIFKVKVYIKDRALHTSNVVESPDLTLPSISIN